MATAAGARSLRGRPPRDSSSLLELVAGTSKVSRQRSSSIHPPFPTNAPLGEPVIQLPSCGRSFLDVDASKIKQLLRNFVSNAVRVPSLSAISATISLLSPTPCNCGRSTTLPSAGR